MMQGSKRETAIAATMSGEATERGRIKDSRILYNSHPNSGRALGRNAGSALTINRINENTLYRTMTPPGIRQHDSSINYIVYLSKFLREHLIYFWSEVGRIDGMVYQVGRS